MLPTLTKSHLVAILKQYKKFPGNHRDICWRFLLALPNNEKRVIDYVQEYKIANEDQKNEIYIAANKLQYIFSEMYPISSSVLKSRVEKVCLALYRWSPCLAQTVWLPKFVFPFIKFYNYSTTSSFETVVCLLKTFESFVTFRNFLPNRELYIINTIIEHHFHLPNQQKSKLKDIHQFNNAHPCLKNLESQQKFIFNLFTTVFTEILTGDEWLSLMDNIFTNQNVLYVYIILSIFTARELSLEFKHRISNRLLNLQVLDEILRASYIIFGSFNKSHNLDIYADWGLLEDETHQEMQNAVLTAIDDFDKSFAMKQIVQIDATSLPQPIDAPKMRVRDMKSEVKDVETLFDNKYDTGMDESRQKQAKQMDIQKQLLKEKEQIEKIMSQSRKTDDFSQKKPNQQVSFSENLQSQNNHEGDEIDRQLKLLQESTEQKQQQVQQQQQNNQQQNLQQSQQFQQNNQQPRLGEKSSLIKTKEDLLRSKNRMGTSAQNVLLNRLQEIPYPKQFQQKSGLNSDSRTMTEPDLKSSDGVLKKSGNSSGREDVQVPVVLEAQLILKNDQLDAKQLKQSTTAKQPKNAFSGKNVNETQQQNTFSQSAQQTPSIMKQTKHNAQSKTDSQINVKKDVQTKKIPLQKSAANLQQFVQTAQQEDVEEKQKQLILQRKQQLAQKVKQIYANQKVEQQQKQNKKVIESQNNLPEDMNVYDDKFDINQLIVAHNVHEEKKVDEIVKSVTNAAKFEQTNQQDHHYHQNTEDLVGKLQSKDHEEYDKKSSTNDEVQELITTENDQQFDENVENQLQDSKVKQIEDKITQQLLMKNDDHSKTQSLSSTEGVLQKGSSSSTNKYQSQINQKTINNDNTTTNYYQQYNNQKNTYSDNYDQKTNNQFNKQNNNQHSQSNDIHNLLQQQDPQEQAINEQYVKLQQNSSDQKQFLEDKIQQIEKQLQEDEKKLDNDYQPNNIYKEDTAISKVSQVNQTNTFGINSNTTLDKTNKQSVFEDAKKQIYNQLQQKPYLDGSQSHNEDFDENKPLQQTSSKYTSQQSKTPYQYQPTIYNNTMETKTSNSETNPIFKNTVFPQQKQSQLQQTNPFANTQTSYFQSQTANTATQDIDQKSTDFQNYLKQLRKQADSIQEQLSNISQLTDDSADKQMREIKNRVKNDQSSLVSSQQYSNVSKNIRDDRVLVENIKKSNQKLLEEMSSRVSDIDSGADSYKEDNELGVTTSINELLQQVRNNVKEFENPRDE